MAKVVFPDTLQKVPDPQKENIKWFKRVSAKLRRQRWRLNNLYKIVDADGETTTFKMRLAQKLLYLGMWYLNIILKSRQHGITTYICLFFLDTCLFNSNTSACIIAHNKDDAKDFFTKKILFAYNNLDPMIRKAIPAKRSSTNELVFENGSSIRVTTSGRSGTYQLIHISEFGKICAKYPHKAEEIQTGTLNAIHPGNIVFIESTAEGREGEFYKMTTEAQKAKFENAKLTQMDWKFFFFGWMDNVLNQLSRAEAKTVVITERFKKYFEKVEAGLRRRIPLEYKAWYIKKEGTQGELMFREHPSTPEEAFLQSIKGVYYATQMIFLRKNNRFLKLPMQPGYPVDTWWDIGFNDINAIWFTQTVGRMIHVIDFYQNHSEGLIHYAQYLRDRKAEFNYSYGKHWAPHDIAVHEWVEGHTRREAAKEYGVNFWQAPKLTIESGIEMVRKLLPYCLFDLEKTDAGIIHLEAYRKEWDEKRATYRNKPYHDAASNAADAFRTGAVVHPFTRALFNIEGMIATPKAPPAPDPKGWS